MPASLLLLAVVLGGVSCNQLGEKKPAVVDWEKNNFGIRTSHSSQDFLNDVNIDTNAPQITRKKGHFRHESRRKEQKPPIIRNNLRIRSRKDKIDGDDKEVDISHGTRVKKIVKKKNAEKNIASKSNNERDRLGIRVRSRKTQRQSLTTESIPKADTTVDISTLKPNFLEVKESFTENLAYSGKSLRTKFFSRNKTLNIPKGSVKTTTKKIRTDFWHRTTQSKNSLLKSATSTKRSKELQTESDGEMIKDDSIETTTNAIEERTTENVVLNTIIDTDVEFVTKSESMRRKSNDNKYYRGRRIPEIGDPAIEKKLNRLTVAKKINPTQNRKESKSSSRRRSFVRSRGTQKKAMSNEEFNTKDEAEGTKLITTSVPRLRSRRPGFRNKSNLHKEKSNNEKDPKMIRRMRIKSKDKNTITEEAEFENKAKDPISKEGNVAKRPSRLRLQTSKRNFTGRRTPSFVKPSSETKEKPPHHASGRRGFRASTIATTKPPTSTTSTTTTTTTTVTTTEKITIRPNAHRISYTLDDSAFVDMTSETPIYAPEHISEISTNINMPSAKKPKSEIPKQDKIKAKETSSETFLPTLVPLRRKTPSKILSDEVPIFVAGTNQSEKSLEDARDIVQPPPVKRGRYILAATSFG